MKKFLKILVCSSISLIAFAMNQSEKNSALFKAVYDKDVKALLAAIKDGADVNAKNRSGNTPIHEATANADTYLVQTLVKFCPDLKIKNKDSKDVIKIFYEKFSNYLGSILLKANAKIDSADLDKCIKNLDISSKLLTYAISDDVKSMDELLQNEINPDLLNSTDASGVTALIYASSRGNSQMVKILLDCNSKFGGLDISQPCNFGESALFLAKRNKQNEVLELLDKHGKDSSNQICLTATLPNPIARLIVKLVFGDVFKKI